MTKPSKLALASRLILGLVFVVFGLNGFLQFLPQPPLPAGPALTFVTGLLASGYFFPMLKAIEVVAGVLLLAGLFVPLVLTVLAPIVVNIVAFHLFLVPGGMPIALLVLAAELHQAYVHRAAYAGLFQARSHRVDRSTALASAQPAVATGSL